MLAVPCKGCESRKIDCHEKCERYEAYSKERMDLHNSRQSQYLLSTYQESQTINAKWRKKWGMKS